LTDAALLLLGADSSTVVVWDDRRDLGLIRAGSGRSAAFVDTAVGPESGPFEGKTPDGERFNAEAPGVVEAARTAAAIVTIPIDGFLPTRMFLTVSWREPQTPEALERAVQGLRALTRLTQRSSEAEVELARLHEQARLDTVLECVGDGVWLESDEGPRVNQAARDLLKLGPGDSVRDLDPVLRRLDGTPIPLAETPRALAVATRASVPFMLQQARMDGILRVFQGTAAPVYGSSGFDPIGTAVTFRDVTEEHNRNLLTERFLEQLFEALPLAVGVAEPASGEILSVNQAFGKLVGYDPEEMVGALPPHPWWAEAQDLEPGEAPRPCEALFRRRDGRLVPVELVPLLVSEASGRPAATVTLITDLSERRRFEQQMVQSGRLAAIGELAAGVAHEINNPLFAILGLVEFLLKEVEPGTKAHDRLRLVQQTGLEIKDVVRALLDFARERSDELELVELRDVLEQTVDLVRRTTLRKEIELVERYAPGSTIAFASPGQLKQVVLNLVTNAQQAMNDTGTITVELAREGDRAVVRVTDTGPGIAADVVDRIFDPFFTTKRELGGTGLGLSLSQSIVDAHGGTLTASSPPGGGAEFAFTLPLAGPGTEPAP
jgi:PAS domain S-box-containing protein